VRLQTAAVLGTGMMGPGIAGSLALGGLRTMIVSRDAARAETALDRARSQLTLLAGAGVVDAARAERTASLLSATNGLEGAVSNVDLVIESAPEDMAFKQELFASLDRLARPDAVLASNTSGLSITVIASQCKRPERVFTAHYWNPPHLMPFVEIVLGARSDAVLAEELKTLLTACGKKPVIVKKDTPGQLGNRLQMALVREAAHMIEAGIAEAEDIDAAVRFGFGLRFPAYGLLEHQDIVGLDMATVICNYVSSDLYSERQAPRIMHDKVAQGDLGAKTGRGFYDWSAKDAGEVKARRDNFVLEMLQRAAKRDRA